MNTIPITFDLPHADIWALRDRRPPTVEAYRTVPAGLRPPPSP